MKKSFTFFTLLLLIPVLINAATSGKIKGIVVDATTQEPLIGANVIIMGTSFGAATDVNGEYSISNLEADTYVVRASFIGYQAITISNVRVSSDLTTELKFELPSQDISVAEVSIVAQRPLVNKSNTNAIRVTTSDDIEALPVRGMANIIGLSAGVVLKDNTVFIRGGRLDEVGYYLEGISVRNPVTGGSGVTVAQDAVEEVQVQAGGYTAEYGGANAGIIRQQLKTGSRSLKASVEYITDNITFKSKDNAFDGEKRLGAYWFGYNEIIGSLSGPVLSEKVRFFGLIDYNYQRDANPQPYPGINLGYLRDNVTGDSINLVYPAGPIYGNSLNAYTYTGTITADLMPVQLRFAGTLSNNTTHVPFSTHRNAGNIANILNTNRIEQLDAINGSGSFKLTHVLSDKMFYEANFGYYYQGLKRFDPLLKDNFLSYGDSVANAAVGATFASRWGRPDRIDIYNFSFNGPGDVLAGYQKFKRESMTFNFSLSWLPNKEHALKIGGEYQRYALRNYSWNNERVFSLAQLLANPGGRTAEQIIASQGPNNYGYDEFGNETSDGGFFGPKHPVFASAYIQDKIDLNDIIVNFGLRFDYIDSDNYELINPALPDLTFDFNSGAIKEDGLVKVPTFSAISPRIGISFPVTDRTMFHAQYGKFVQQTRLADIYQGLYATSNVLRGGLFINLPVGFNLRPTRTTQYEIGFTQQLGDFASFDITGYYKDVKDQVVFDLQQVDKTSQFKSYNIYRNGDFATTKGLELSFNMRRTKRLAINASMSFQDAEGTGSFPNSNRGIVGAPLDGVTIFRPQYISPLDFNNALRGNLNIDYHFGIEDGPSWLQEAGASLLITFSSGHPFTLGIGGEDLEGDSRDRQPIEALNSSSTPSTFQADLRIDKTFQLFDKLRLNVYVFVINLFDAKNIENVFLRTGSTSDDGYISDPNLSGELVNQPGYVDLYRAINIDYYERWQNAPALFTVPYFYGPPRQIRLGIKLEY